MPITYIIRSDLRLILITHTGVVADDEFLQGYRKLSNDKKFNISFNRLVDLRNTDSRIRSSDALANLAKLSEHKHRETDSVPKTAVIAPTDLSYGLVRMYNALSSDAAREIVVFKSVAQALSWLDAPADLLSDQQE